MKYEWRRQEKQLYGVKTTPVLVYGSDTKLHHDKR